MEPNMEWERGGCLRQRERERERTNYDPGTGLNGPNCQEL